jgi:hypothetical protein
LKSTGVRSPKSSNKDDLPPQPHQKAVQYLNRKIAMLERKLSARRKHN